MFQASFANSSFFMQSFTVTDHEDGLRLDKWLKNKLPAAPASFIYKLVRHKKVKKEKKKMFFNDIVNEGETINIWLPEETIQEMRPERRKIHPSKKSFTVVGEDPEFMIIDKPAGLPVHGGTNIRGKTLMQELLGYFAYTKGYEHLEPSLLHRIDKDTFGLLIIAKNRKALTKWNELMKTGAFEKTYRARIVGIPNEDHGHIHAPLLIYKNTQGGQAKANIVPKNHPDAKTAHTEYRIIKKEPKSNTSIVEISLHTGRTHQIRVHMAHIGYPLVGDRKYGDNTKNESLKARGHQLQSYKLRFNGKTYTSKGFLPEV